MRELKEGKRLTIFVGEDKQFEGKPLYIAVLELLKRSDIAGATATKGFSGFRCGGQFHSTSTEYLIVDLPVVVEAIDEAAKIDSAIENVCRLPDLALVEVTPITLITN